MDEIEEKKEKMKNNKEEEEETMKNKKDKKKKTNTKKGMNKQKVWAIIVPLGISDIDQQSSKQISLVWKDDIYRTWACDSDINLTEWRKTVISPSKLLLERPLKFKAEQKIIATDH